MTDAVGIHAHPTLKLGVRPEDTTRPKVQFADFLTATTIPTHTASDHIPNYTWPMDRNDIAGVCVVAGGDHTLEAIYRLLGLPYTNWSDAFILKAYQVQNPGFKSWADAGGPNDGGMNVAAFLDWCIAQKLILGYGQINTANLEEIRAAIYLGLGVIHASNLTVAQQTGKVWDYVPGSPAWGAHCTTWAGYDANGLFDTVSWGSGLYRMTPAFIQRQVTEGYFVLTKAHLTRPSLRAGYNLQAFSTAVKQITNGKVIVPTTPTTSSPAKRSMWQRLWGWL
jgi:hypothetical protein